MLAVRFGPLDLQDACRSLTRLSNLPLHKTTQSGSWKEGHIRMSDSSTITLPFANKVLVCVVRLCLCVSAWGWWEQWWLDPQLFADLSWKPLRSRTVTEKHFDSMLLKHCKIHVMKGHWMKAVKTVVTYFYHFFSFAGLEAFRLVAFCTWNTMLN